MRNVSFDKCNCECDDQFKINGIIKNGRRYDNGNVPEEKYNKDMVEIQNKINNIGEVIDQLDVRISRLENEKEPLIVISNFTASPKTLELGSTRNIVVSWNLSKSAAKTTLNGINVLNQVVYTDSDVSADKEYKLIVTDDLGREVKASTKVSFVNRVYWGVSAETDITEVLVKSLENNVLSGSKERTITVAPDHQYIYYAFPVRLGTAVFKQGYFEGGFEDPATVRVSNGSGYSEDYYVYRSTKNLSAEVTVEVK